MHPKFLAYTHGLCAVIRRSIEGHCTEQEKEIVKETSTVEGADPHGIENLGECSRDQAKLGNVQYSRERKLWFQDSSLYQAVFVLEECAQNRPNQPLIKAQPELVERSI